MTNAAPGDRYEVVAVRYGRAHSHRSDLFYRYGAYGEPDAPQDMDFYFYVLRGGGRTILIDTGFDPRAAPPRNRICLIPPREALGVLGIAPGDVDAVAITHFHWDHIGNIDYAPRAELVVPVEEVEFWERPVARRPQFWAHTDPDWLARLQEVHGAGGTRVLPAGGGEVAPGVRSLTVGGHSAGQQVVVVESADGPVVLASDAVHLYEELELERPFAVITDLEAMYRAYATLRELERDGAVAIVPGHDPEIAARFTPLDGPAGGFAFRIA